MCKRHWVPAFAGTTGFFHSTFSYPPVGARNTLQSPCWRASESGDFHCARDESANVTGSRPSPGRPVFHTKLLEPAGESSQYSALVVPANGPCPITEYSSSRRTPGPSDSVVKRRPSRYDKFVRNDA